MKREKKNFLKREREREKKNEKDNGAGPWTLARLVDYETSSPSVKYIVKYNI